MVRDAVPPAASVVTWLRCRGWGPWYFLLLDAGCEDGTIFTGFDPKLLGKAQWTKVVLAHPNGESCFV